MKLLPPMETEIAWAAGVIDGEGCFTLYKGKKLRRRCVTLEYRLMFIVSMVHLPTVKKLHQIFKVGSIFRDKRKNVSKNKRASYRWQVNGGMQCAQFIPLILPYLFTKREEAEVALRFVKLRSLNKNRGFTIATTQEAVEEKERYYCMLRDLKRYEWRTDKYSRLK